MTPLDAEAALAKLQTAVQPLLAEQPLVVGIHTGGAWVAARLHAALGLSTPLSTLNIAFHRDDFEAQGLHPRVGPSDLRVDIENRMVLLVDDVLHTGRTVRAAMNELFDYGRPRAIRLAVLVDRSGRELPVAADYSGLRVDLPPGRQIKLRGPQPLVLTEQ